MSLIEIELTPLNKKQVIIKPEEIEKINSHIKILAEAVQNEKNRTETLIDKDLSRLGNYMAVWDWIYDFIRNICPMITYKCTKCTRFERQAKGY